MIKYYVLLCMFLISINVMSLTIGDVAPDFTIRTGDKREIKLADCNNKIVVIFYETKENKEKNRDLKKYLNSHYPSLNGNLKVKIKWLPIINCTATWPFTSIWEKELVKNSRIEGFDIFGDWNGKVLSKYGFDKNEPNFMIIDGKGIIKYAKTGVIKKERFEEIKEIIDSLTNL